MVISLKVNSRKKLVSTAFLMIQASDSRTENNASEMVKGITK
jgi:hypothetical protein